MRYLVTVTTANDEMVMQQVSAKTRQIAIQKASEILKERGMNLANAEFDVEQVETKRVASAEDTD